MPVITFDGGKLTKDQKAELVCEFTSTAARVTGIQKEAFVILIRENDRENIGSGGELLCDKLKGK
jgi:4-oxalocrotonate tautomerase